MNDEQQNYLLIENSNLINEEKIEKLNNTNIIFNGKIFVLNKKGTTHKKKKKYKSFNI